MTAARAVTRMSMTLPVAVHIVCCWWLCFKVAFLVLCCYSCCDFICMRKHYSARARARVCVCVCVALSVLFQNGCKSTYLCMITAPRPVPLQWHDVSPFAQLSHQISAAVLHYCWIFSAGRTWYHSTSWFQEYNHLPWVCQQKQMTKI
jgi:hypothetical protein